MRADIRRCSDINGWICRLPDRCRVGGSNNVELNMMTLTLTNRGPKNYQGALKHTYFGVSRWFMRLEPYSISRQHSRPFQTPSSYWPYRLSATNHVFHAAYCMQRLTCSFLTILNLIPQRIRVYCPDLLEHSWT